MSSAFPGPEASEDAGVAEVPDDPESFGYEGFRFLEERAEISWGRDNDQHSSFTTFLNVSHKVDQARQEIDIDFSLCRCIESVVLWDRRPGGCSPTTGS